MYELCEYSAPELKRCYTVDEFIATYKELRATEMFKNAIVYPVVQPQKACIGVILYAPIEYPTTLTVKPLHVAYGVHLILSLIALRQAPSLSDLWTLFTEQAREFEEALLTKFQKYDNEVKK